MNKKNILPQQMKVFWMTFVAMFLIISLNLLGVKPLKLLTPIAPSEPIDTFTALLPKLEETPLKFALKKKPGFIASAQAAGEYDSANAYAVVDMKTGEIILEKNGNSSIAIASITKVMTSVVALDLAKPTNSFLVSKEAASIEPTKIGVIPGQHMTLDELLNAALLTSANDAVEVIREGVDSLYGEKIFVKAMNAKATYLGLRNTSFDNPQGFDGAKNYSSALDLAILAQYAMTNYPVIADIVKKDYVLLPENPDHKQFDLYNWNGLIGVYPNTSGLKIGNTDDAGKTTLVTSERNGHQLIVVVLGAPGTIERDLWAAQLLDVGFERAYGLPKINITESDLYDKYATWQYFN